MRGVRPATWSSEITANKGGGGVIVAAILIHYLHHMASNISRASQLRAEFKDYWLLTLYTPSLGTSPHSLTRSNSVGHKSAKGLNNSSK